MMSGDKAQAAQAERMMDIDLVVNGEPQTFRIRADETLYDVLRREGYKGTKQGCSEGTCGACTVLMDGLAIASCITLAAQAHGRHVMTVEGLGTPTEPHILQDEFDKAGAVQCGFCIPGMLLAAKALLDRTLEPTDGQVREALDGNLCRCTGYVKQLEAVHNAAARMRAEEASAKSDAMGEGGAE